THVLLVHAPFGLAGVRYKVNVRLKLLGEVAKPRHHLGLLAVILPLVKPHERRHEVIDQEYLAVVPTRGISKDLEHGLDVGAAQSVVQEERVSVPGPNGLGGVLFHPKPLAARLWIDVLFKIPSPRGLQIDPVPEQSRRQLARVSAYPVPLLNRRKQLLAQERALATAVCTRPHG